MTEAPDVYPDFPDDDETDESVESDDPGVEGHVRTADARVDAVLESLADVDQRPVADHASVFERAHEQLRAALEPDRGPA